jgi:hypothetical protein
MHAKVDVMERLLLTSRVWCSMREHINRYGADLLACCLLLLVLGATWLSGRS